MRPGPLPLSIHRFLKLFSCSDPVRSVYSEFQIRLAFSRGLILCKASPPNMWKFKPFSHKEPTGLEGRVMDIGNYKVQVRNAIAEGGFSCVYLARDVTQGSKQFALKHMIYNDPESEELVMKEIKVMKILKGHPNIVTLYSHAIFDMGRTKEAFLLLEYCEKSLVNVLESRGSAGFFDEKQVLSLFRDVCNAVFAMHCLFPPVAHRDLKAENLLLGSDGLWKLCDFGSTSTNHKRFEKPEEMGIEEDNIRKHTTPAYRAPEMWDLFRRETINEKVDIWALGCLLFRVCYLKSAFDGESKLQVLNGNYRIPDQPKYNALLTELIKDMLQSSPDDRPDITQVWFRVNDLLPDGLQRSLPDRPPEMQQNSSDIIAGMPKPSNRSSPMPRRSPPPPPASEAPQNAASASKNSRTGESAGPIGSFWSTQHAKEADGKEVTRPKYDEDTSDQRSGNEISPDRDLPYRLTPKLEQGLQFTHVEKKAQGRTVSRPSLSSRKDLNLFPDDSVHSPEIFKHPKTEVTPSFQNDAFNAFVAEFPSNAPSPGSNLRTLEKDKALEAEVEKLKEQLACVNAEKAEVTSKYEKLTAICRSQRQEIQDLKQALASRTPSPSRDSSRNLSPTGPPQNEKIEGTIWELQQGLLEHSSGSQSQQWQAFTDDPKAHAMATNNTPKSVRTTRNGPQNKGGGVPSSWGFETDSFKVSSSNINVGSVREVNHSRRFVESNSVESKPAGWAGF